jgi:hypothetical protein
MLGPAFLFTAEWSASCFHTTILERDDGAAKPCNSSILACGSHFLKHDLAISYLAGGHFGPPKVIVLTEVSLCTEPGHLVILVQKIP